MAAALAPEEEIKKLVLNKETIFWQALADRDIDLRLSLCADNVTFIGSGLNEKASNKKEYYEINRKGLEQLPERFTIHYYTTQASVLDDMAWVESEIEWEQNLHGNFIKELLRSTVVFKKIEGEWLIVHVHGSVPDFRFTGDNYMSYEAAITLNRELEQMVYQRTEALNKTLEELKATQSQLIQSEKMASLGELTAGIAHEIQNPLNFVNNFSEVNAELLAEMQGEIDKGNYDEAKAIAADMADNESKIMYHGKRADAIVKGMLQHSRTSMGQKEPTDINALCDEYLRLSYHGLRAKDKSFNADFTTHFDDSIGKINIIPQDIGRVILNLFTNAFYAVNEKKHSAADKNYSPRVSIETKKEKDKVIINVKDNGNGVSKNIQEKIFQPFFTTKPTGKGTGLGLSMSYDIVKTHGGLLSVESNEQGGSCFRVTLLYEG